MIAFAIYGYLILISALNWLFIYRPKKSQNAIPKFVVLIPARNESETIQTCVVPLVTQGIPVVVFDDESTDATALRAKEAGAQVLRSPEPKPEGWVGKNWACAHLADHPTAKSSEWILFLDADTQPSAQFGARVNDLIDACTDKYAVASGFPVMLPGRGLEPLYLSWVPWIILASNPFAIISKSGKGHPAFANGQFILWKTSTYHSVKPHELLKDRILEDVLIGRHLAQKRIPLFVANLTGFLKVRMYRDIRESIDGMSKNTYAITGNPLGNAALCLTFLLLAWGWIFFPDYRWWLYLCLCLSKLISDLTVNGPLWTVPFAPITSTLAALTCIRSYYWYRKGKIQWKGRLYSN